MLNYYYTISAFNRRLASPSICQAPYYAHFDFGDTLALLPDVVAKVDAWFLDGFALNKTLIFGK
jgi:hypothetical protein